MWWRKNSHHVVNVLVVKRCVRRFWPKCRVVDVSFCFNALHFHNLQSEKEWTAVSPKYRKVTCETKLLFPPNRHVFQRIFPRATPWLILWFDCQYWQFDGTNFCFSTLVSSQDGTIPSRRQFDGLFEHPPWLYSGSRHATTLHESWWREDVHVRNGYAIPSFLQLVAQVDSLSTVDGWFTIWARASLHCFCATCVPFYHSPSLQVQTNKTFEMDWTPKHKKNICKKYYSVSST